MLKKSGSSLVHFFFRPSDGERVRERDSRLTDDDRERKDREREGRDVFFSCRFFLYFRFSILAFMKPLAL